MRPPNKSNCSPADNKIFAQDLNLEFRPISFGGNFIITDRHDTETTKQTEGFEYQWGPFVESNPPIVEYPEMTQNNCSCCEKIEEIYEFLRVDKLRKSSVPKRFLAGTDAKGLHKMKDADEILAALFLMINNQDFVPFQSKVQVGSEELGVRFANPSQAFQSILDILLNKENAEDNEEIKFLDRKVSEMSSRLAIILAQILPTVVANNELLLTIIEYLGFKTQDILTEVNSPIDPFTLKSIPEFSSLDDGDETNDKAIEYNEKLLAAIFQDCILQVPTQAYADNGNLQKKLLEILIKAGGKK